MKSDNYNNSKICRELAEMIVSYTRDGAQGIRKFKCMFV